VKVLAVGAAGQAAGDWAGTAVGGVEAVEGVGRVEAVEGVGRVEARAEHAIGGDGGERSGRRWVVRGLAAAIPAQR
jgi:hypothetical protein